VYGDDYPTPDGTCVRDYIDVADLADAHVAAAAHAEAGVAAATYNVGTGVGLSVREVLDVVRATTGTDLVPEVVPRRPGDPAALVAAADLIRDELGWSATRGIDESVASAWSAWQAFPPVR
jgi:UDP-glucose 4-epimerase